ncbi:hypothetical protein [Nonomuraea salmonea]|uniref:PE-PGRS family protein n=1 Tax=Nonomuraea salmonea TaxID=46181 RepID=A0ABV5P1I5_9ACTN
MAAWIAGLPAERKDALLLRVIEEDAASVRWELLGEFGGERSGRETETGRTVAELLDNAAARRHAREQQETARRAEEQARREQEHRRAQELPEPARPGSRRRVRRGGGLHRHQEAPRIRPGRRAPARPARLTLRDEHASAFTQRLTHLRERHQGKHSLIKRLNDAGLMAE